MTNDEICRQIIIRLNFILPSHDAESYWRQNTYRGDFFKLFAESYNSCKINGEQIEQHLNDHWLSQGICSEFTRQAIMEICQAWDEWGYAWDNHASYQLAV